jgi:PAS domain S-box-containing protein
MSQRPAQPLLEAVGYGARDRFVVALLYATFAGLWILLSDEVVTWLFSDPASVALASTFKGMAFVTVTSLLLYLLLRRRDGGADGERPRLQPGWPFALMAGAIVAFIAAGILRDYDNQRRTEVKQLQTIAELKTRQIADWLAERHREAEFVATSSYYALQYRRWQTDRDGAAGQELQARLRKFLHARGFSHVSLLDPAGRLLWSTHAEQIAPTPALLAAVRIAASTRQVARSEPYVQADAHPRLDFVVPLATTGTGAPPTVVVHAYLDSWLYPTLQSWPVPSASGEILIVRRDGDRVLYLNDLRHQSGTALRMRLPLAERDLPAARALRGEVRPGEAVEGRDYRGVAVLGVARAVPDSDWFLVAKVDRAELIGHALRSATWLGLAGLLALVILAGSLVLVRQRGQLILAEGVREAQAERLRALNLLAAIADSSEDAIYAKDLEGRYILFNRAASRFVGKTMEEVLGRDDRALFPAAQAEQLMDLGRRVVAENRAITDEDTLTTPVGERVFLATKAPLYNGDGHIIGTYGISRDITERKRTESELQARNEELERFNRATEGRELDMLEMKKAINALSRELGREAPYPLAFLKDGEGEARP